MNGDRIFEIDVVRGVAMFAVCLSHFCSIYLYPNLTHAGHQVIWIEAFCRFASPAFMVISGSMLGFLYETQEQKWPEMKTKLLDRGLFLASMGHLLMMTGHIAQSHNLLDLCRWEYITDTIGICVIIGCVLIGRMRIQTIMFLGGGMLTLSSAVMLLWNPQNAILNAVKETFFGSLNPVFYLCSFPIFLWLGLYLFGICVGRKLGSFRKQSGICGVRTALKQSFLVLFCVALALKGVQTIFIDDGTPAHWIGSIMVKSPPSPAFLLFFGAVTLLILLGVFEIARIDKVRKLLSPIAVLGRTCFFVFLIQFYVYNTAIYLLKLPYSGWWPLYFLASMTVIWTLSKIWDVKRLNSIITFRRFGSTGTRRHRTGMGTPFLPNLMTEHNS